MELKISRSKKTQLWSWYSWSKDIDQKGFNLFSWKFEKFDFPKSDWDPSVLYPISVLELETCKTLRNRIVYLDSTDLSHLNYDETDHYISVPPDSWYFYTPNPNMHTQIVRTFLTITNTICTYLTCVAMTRSWPAIYSAVCDVLTLLCVNNHCK